MFDVSSQEWPRAIPIEQSQHDCQEKVNKSSTELHDGCRGNTKVFSNGYLLHCMHKQQDFFGCLAKILGCPGPREAANLEIFQGWQPWEGQDNPKLRPDLQKGGAVWAYNVTGDFDASLARD